MSNKQIEDLKRQYQNNPNVRILSFGKPNQLKIGIAHVESFNDNNKPRLLICQIGMIKDLSTGNMLLTPIFTEPLIDEDYNNSILGAGFNEEFEKHKVDFTNNHPTVFNKLLIGCNVDYKEVYSKNGYPNLINDKTEIIRYFDYKLKSEYDRLMSQ